MPDLLDKYELRNKAVKSAGWQGWRYGMGIGILVAIGFVMASDKGNYVFLIPSFIAGCTFGPLGRSVFVWMEIIRWNAERHDA